jgi:mannose-6-phosphate isomerase-like protein (cupin superfamily)
MYSNIEFSEGSHAMSATATETTAAAPRWFITNLVRVLVAPGQSGDALGIVDLTGTGGEMPPLHVHHLEDEIFVVLEGTLSLHLPGRSVTLEAGQAFVAPKGVPHVYRVESDRARWLGVSTPGGFASFVLAASVPAEVDDLPPADRELDFAQLVACAEEHGIEILAPPGTMP